MIIRKIIDSTSNKPIYWLYVFSLLTMQVPSMCAQQVYDSIKVYQVSPWLELSISAGSFVLAKKGFSNLGRISRLNIDQLSDYDHIRANGLDRRLSCFRNCAFERSQEISDLALNITLIAPISLIFDRRIRKDWFDILALYVESEVINTGVYLGSAHLVRRTRPLVYDITLSDKQRSGNDRTNSFYSGHVGNTATASFFMAKVYTDYHQIKGWARIGLYGLASIPPSFVGYHRIKSGKHFFSDVAVGYLAGGLLGILIPEIHRIKKRNLIPSVWIKENEFGCGLALQF